MTAATATATARDSQRSAVYAAEAMFRDLLDTQYSIPTVRIAGSTVTVPQERRWATVQDIQAYVSRLAPGVRVLPRQDAGKATYSHYPPTIHIPVHRSAPNQTPWAMRASVLLHEIAHHRSPGHRHGPTFCAEFLALISQEMGPEAHFLLSVLYLENGVRIH